MLLALLVGCGSGSGGSGAPGSAGGGTGAGAAPGTPVAVRVSGVFKLAAEGTAPVRPQDGWAQDAAAIALRNALRGAPGMVLAGDTGGAAAEVRGEVRHLSDAWALDLKVTPAGGVPGPSLRAVGPTLRAAALMGAQAVRRALRLPDAEWPDDGAADLARLPVLFDAVDGGDASEANVMVERWHAERPERVLWLALLARVRRAGGDMTGAREAIDASLVREPLVPWARLEKARLMLDALRTKEARSLVDGARLLSKGGPDEAKIDAVAALLSAAIDRVDGKPAALFAFASDPRAALVLPADRAAIARAAFWAALAATPDAPVDAGICGPAAGLDAVAAAYREACLARAGAAAGAAGTAAPASAPTGAETAPAAGAARAAAAAVRALVAAKPAGLAEALREMDRTHAGELGIWAAMLVAELHWRIGGAERAAASGWYARVVAPAYERWRTFAEYELAQARLTELRGAAGAPKP